jgi:hypothetical protein
MDICTACERSMTTTSKSHLNAARGYVGGKSFDQVLHMLDVARLSDERRVQFVLECTEI